MYLAKSRPLERLFATYPTCENVTTVAGSDIFVVVQACLSHGHPERTAALTTMTFGPALWIAQVVHVVVTEAYLHYTGDEDEKLKLVSGRRRKTKMAGLAAVQVLSP